MGMIGVNSGGNLYFDFEYQGMRCIEYASLVRLKIQNKLLLKERMKR